MSNTVKRSDLFRQYACIIDMCEGTNVDVLDCIKFDGRSLNEFNKSERNPEFNLDPSYYSFAIAILKGKPLFIGDTVYHVIHGKMVISEFGPLPREFIDQVSWNKPERKIKIAGVKLPRPLDELGGNHKLIIGDTKYHFRTGGDMCEFMDRLVELINRAMNETK